MVQMRLPVALNARDNIVGQAYSDQSSPIVSLQNGFPLKAALTDYIGNLLEGAVPKTVAGLGIVTSLPLIAYQGWVGGIVSVDGNHASRFAQPWEAAYYVITLLLQLVPYTLAGGAGVYLGLAFYKNYSNKQVAKWLGFLPKAAVVDVARIYILVIPLFLVASLWEFLVR